MTTVTAAPYDGIADLYDVLSPPDGHAAWVQRLVALARSHGLAGERVLDVGCGSGRSFGVLLREGLTVVGVDVSAGMLAVARERFGDEVELHHADMRQMPALGTFDLVLCLDDALNHLEGPADLERTFRRCAANLAPGGLMVFDVLALGAYRGARETVVRHGTSEVRWRVPGAADLAPGGSVEMVVDVVGDGEQRRWRQPHRHHPPAEIERALAAAGLVVAGRYGQRRGGLLDPDVDELTQHKVLTLARRIPTGLPAQRTEEET